MSSICNNCGSTIPDGSGFCRTCGAPAPTAQNSLATPSYNAGYSTPINAPMSGLAIGGFVVSLVGILVAAIICGLVGLGLSIPGLIQTLNGTKRGKGFAIAGLVISIIDVIFGFIAIAFMNSVMYF